MWVWGPLLGGSFVFVVVILFFISIALSALSLSQAEVTTYEGGFREEHLELQPQEAALLGGPAEDEEEA